ncbi:MAG: succinyl-diaminopimelate desuccinylase [Epsilonproteobacteria bacterium]|nr:succinyl-diaminopimelate desuccinylase [Campylobacterota bacterium]
MTLQNLFLKLLRYKSITPNDDNSLEFIEKYMSGFNAIRLDKNDTKNLLLYKKFGDGEHLCFAGHIDVVPPGVGWDSDPFEPIIKDGYIYARGSQDMKSGVCAFLQACKDTQNFRGTLSIVLTSDEEGDAKFGTIEVLKYLKDKNFLPDFAIVAEPTSEDTFGDAIRIGRRGSINGVLEIFGKQGHAAYPQKSLNPVNLIAPILDSLAGHYFDDGDDDFAPSQLVITDIRAGMEVTNVTPGVLKLMFNVRNGVKTSKEDIQNYINFLFKGLDYNLSLYQSAKSFVTKRDSRIVKLLQKIVKQTTNIEPKLNTSGGTSDARLFAEFGVKTVELGVVNNRIHAINERCKFQEIEDLKKVFDRIIEKF